MKVERALTPGPLFDALTRVRNLGIGGRNRRFILCAFFRRSPFSCQIPTSSSGSNILTMGSFKKEAARKQREGKNAGGMGNVKTKGENFYRLVFQKISLAAGYV